MNRFIFFLMIAGSIAACSPQKRLNKLLTKHPELITVQIDTLSISDTVVVPEVQHDTLLKLVSHDTVIIQKDNMEVKYFYNTQTDSIYIDGTCKETIITREIQVPYEKMVVRAPTFWEQVPGILKTLLLLFILALIGKWLWNKANSKKEDFKGL